MQTVLHCFFLQIIMYFSPIFNFTSVVNALILISLLYGNTLIINKITSFLGALIFIFLFIIKCFISD